jgi:hypothetical protein
MCQIGLFWLWHRAYIKRLHVMGKYLFHKKSSHIMGKEEIILVYFISFGFENSCILLGNSFIFIGNSFIMLIFL